MPNYPDTDRGLDDALAADPEATELRQTVILERDWLPEPDAVSLDVRYQVERHGENARLRARLGPHELYLDEPVRLTPVHVPKPWGQEIWLTGIEARGESGVQTAAGILPLSRYLALAPRRLARQAPLVLLKILDPRPEPVLGDLYFEVHEEKREVYVVTRVDPRAWPEGRGGIRFGMNQALRRRYGDDTAFRRDYLHAVQAYEGVRRTLDDGGAVDPAEEARLRAHMESFSEVRPLSVGDVVVVPPWLPHSLQHGVRVIEFQTPTYERYILSFAQKVLTQSHWDTQAAIDRIRLDRPQLPAFDTVAGGAERIVAFDDFQVWRITVPSRGSFTLPAHASYGLCVVVSGSISLGTLTLGAEQAAFVPAAALAGQHRADRATVVNHGSAEAVVLLAAPDL